MAEQGDGQLTIVIRTLADKYGSQQVQEELNKVKGAGVAAHQAVNREAEKSVLTHHALKAAIRHLPPEFQFLGTVAHAIMNRLTFSVAGIVSAWELWKWKVNALSQSMVSMKLADPTPEMKVHVDRLKASWESVHDTVRKTIEDYLSVQAAAERYAKFDTDQIAAKRRQAAALEKSSAAKLAEAAGIHIATPEEDAATEARLRKDAEEAKRAEADHIARRRDIVDLEAMGKYDPRRAFLDQRFQQRYGYGTTYEQAKAIEAQEDTATPQNRLRAFLAQKAERDRVRAERAALFSGGTKEAAAAAALRMGIPDEAAAAALGTSGITGVVAGGAEAMTQIREQGNKATPAQLQQLRSLAALLSSINANNWTMINLIEGSHGNVQALAARVRQIEARQKQLAVH